MTRLRGGFDRIFKHANRFGNNGVRTFDGVFIRPYTGPLDQG